ncbi:hypothetical protein BDZ89DRAFT_1161035 [Hymenopellis radicata]|nr:hypothetical protein BDZ89DRAFT_1161035 [Hymenopellis radicata]
MTNSMSSMSLEDLGITVADVQYALSAKLHSTVLLVFGYALHTCVFILALSHTLLGANSLDRQRIIFACIITFLWGSQSALTALNWWNNVHSQFITHGASLQSELLYYSTSGLTAKNADASTVAVVVIQSVNVIVADMVLMWRCWILYGRTWKITAPLTACLLIEILTSSVLITLESRRNGSYLQETKWTFGYCCTTVFSNGLCTFLIVWRLVRSNRFLRTYRKLIEILIESALAYTIAYLALLVVYAHDFYTGLWFLCSFRFPWAVSNSITGIAPTLIICHVMAGKSRLHDSSTSRSAPRIQSTAVSLEEPSQFIGASLSVGQSILDIALEEIMGVSEDGTDGDQDGHDVDFDKSAQAVPLRH